MAWDLSDDHELLRTTVFLSPRQKMIIGAGSESWRIVRDLAARLPAMILPRWARSRSQPVAIEDVVEAILAHDCVLGGEGNGGVIYPAIHAGRDALVGIAMVRVMGAVMVGVIMAGRTGAAFAAQLGTMQVNEETDALETLGISSMDFLVLPRMLALILMMPLLTLYSGIVGMLAGLTVAIIVFDIGLFEYYQQTVRALDLRQFAVGVSKGTVYGILIAIAGCLRGMQCGRSAQAVGQATTSAVVTSIVFIVIAASVLTILFQQLGI